MLSKLHRVVPATQNIIKLTVLSLAISSLVGCDEDLKDCQGFWDNVTGRSECSANASSQPAQQALSADVKKAFGADPNKEDTDGDGLSDTFEITKGYPYLKPDNKDTDANGIEDAKDDTDKDGLTNLEEMQANTSPINPDTDGDGLNDKAELQTYKTNPLVADTDKDTIIDGREIANGSDPLIADADKFVTSSDTHAVLNEKGATQTLTVAIAGKGDLASKVEVKGWSDFKTPFQVGRSYDISLDDIDKAKMQDATITLPYDPNDPAAANPNDLKIYTISPVTGFYEALPTTVDTVNHTITAKTTHFSPYLIGNEPKYFAYVKDIPQSCPLIDDPNAIPVDVALVIDSSGSMLDNDPQNLRIAAAKSFITNMKTSDRAAVVDFDSGVIVRQNLTGNKTDLSNALNQIDADGGTNIGAGVGSAYSVLTSQSDSSHTRVVILLTDGQGSYDTNLSNQLKAQNIRVFTIGLTGQVDEALLKAISSVTNGGYKQINDASGLVGVFGQFATVFGDTGADTDKDGLTDCQEIQGITALNYNISSTKPPSLPKYERTPIFTKYDNPDSDGDGIPDGVEVGPITRSTEFDGTSFVKIFNATILSLPISDDSKGIDGKDSDNDGLSDSEEYEIGSNPLNAHSDDDGIPDAVEVENGTDPSLTDSDNDHINDDKDEFSQFNDEIMKAADWTIKFWVGYTKAKFEFAKSYVAGEWIEIDTIPEYIGVTARGFTPAIGLVGDVTDIPPQLFRKDWLGAGSSAVAAFGGAGYFGTPVVGVVTDELASVPKFILTSKKFFDKISADEASVAIQGASKKLPSVAVPQYIKGVREVEYNLLKNAGVTDEAIASLAKGTGMTQLGEAIKGAAGTVSLSKNAGSIPADRLDNGFLKFWRDGELHVNDGVPKEQRYNKGLHAGVTGGAKTDLRYPDYYNKDSMIAKEAKVGCESSKRIFTQIDKDVALRASGQYSSKNDGLDVGLSWHFFPSAKSNCIGPTKEVMEYLLKHNIKYYVYLP